MSGDGVIILPLPTLPTLPPLPLTTVPLPTLPLPTLPIPTPPPPTVPTVPPPTGSGPAPPGPTGPAATQPTVPGVTGPEPGTTAAPPASSVPTGGTAAPPQEPAPPTASPTTSNATPDCANTTTTSSSAPEDSSPDSSQPSSTEPVDESPPTSDCETPSPENGAAEGQTQSTASRIPDGDLALAAAVASLEVLAVYAYTAVRAGTNAGYLTNVAPPLVVFVATAEAHHQAALDAWNSVLLGAGRTPVTKPPLNLSITVDQSFGTLRDLVSATAVLLSVEATAAATYLRALGALESTPTITLAGSIYPIERQHEAVLRFLTGKYPAPDTFATDEFAYLPDET
jgi:Ferritin-like domain